ncbi:MAG: substrate-binding domain-containing protein [Planctomycetes bacterium]|nr:substrate-binding domain-containing protein [Planctomycetota bacterium]
MRTRQVGSGMGVAVAAGLFAIATVLSGGCVKSGADNGRTADGARSAPARRIILLTNGNSPFWDAARQGLNEAAAQFRIAEAGLSAVMEVNDGTPDGQIGKLRQFVSQDDIAGVAVSALDADNAAVAEQLMALRSKGVHVITVDADVNPEKFAKAREHYVGTDNLAGGRALGVAGRELLKARNTTQGDYVQFVGRTGSDNARKRMDGFKEAVGADYREADRMGDDLDRSKARENVRNAIANHPDLVALVGIWSYNAPAIVDVVVDEKKVRDKYVLVTFDAEPLAIAQMSAGSIDAMVVQDPFQMGFLAVRLLKALSEGDQATVDELFPGGDKPGGDVHNTSLKVVVPDTGSPLKKEMFDSNTEFMTLSTFQEWLKKYNLQGS